MFHLGSYEITLNLPGVSCEMCHGLVEAVLSRQYTETVSSVKKIPKSNNKNFEACIPNMNLLCCVLVGYEVM